MKTTSKKRMLISSVAMLLVAMLALGTATFAWFTSSTTATASGINVQTIKASKLEIASKDTSDNAWGTSVNYGANKTLIPASTADGTTWFTADAAAATAFTKTGNFKPVTVGMNDNNYAFVDELNIRNAGEVLVKDVTITFSIGETGGNHYARVAVVPIENAGADVKKTDFQAKETNDVAKYIFDLDGAAYDAADSATTANTSIKPQSDTSKFSVNVGDIAAKSGDTYTIKSYKIIVWFEGQDVQCFDTNAGNTLPNLSFTVSGTPAKQV